MKRNSSKWTLGFPVAWLGISLALGLWLSAPPFSQAAGRQLLKGHVPKAVAGSPKVKAVEDSTRLHLAIGLPVRDPQGLEQLLSQLYDPHSPHYRQFLTPEQYGERFGATARDYQAVVQFAKSQGLQVEKTYSSRLLLDVSGTTADIQKAFHVNLNYYRRKDGSLFYAPDAEPSVDLDVPLSHISGLDNFHRVWPKSHRGKGRTGGKKGGTGSTGLYQGLDFRDAYVPGLPATVNGAGQSVALLEFDDYYDSDINNYESTSNPSFTAPNPIRVLIPPNVTPTPSAVGVGNGNNDEVTLDIEMVVVLAPGAQVMVYEVPASIFNNGTQLDYETAADDLLSQMATDRTCYQISSSWGGYGDGNTPGILNQLAAQGQAYFEASGDFGSFVASGFPGDSCGDGANTNVTDDQSLYQSKFETLVGGTILTTTPNTGSPPITYTSETTWNDGLGSWNFCGSDQDNLASGGGACTSVLSIPSYQSSVPMGTNGGSSSWRDFPDVAACASNIFLYSENGGYQSGEEGTSAASPLWAAYWALANQMAKAQKGEILGSANPSLYPVGLGSNYNSDFHDINDGSNNFFYWAPTPIPTSSSGPYTAVSGFDLATGWGSPKGQGLITDLVASLPTPTFTPTATGTPTATATSTPTNTPCGWPSNTCTFTPSPTPTNTATPSPTPTGAPIFYAHAWPNVTDGNSPILFTINLTQASPIHIQVYNAAEELIFSATLPGPRGWNQLSWPVQNQEGGPLASGIYIYTVQAAEGKKVGQILVQR